MCWYFLLFCCILWQIEPFSWQACCHFIAYVRPTLVIERVHRPVLCSFFFQPASNSYNDLSNYRVCFKLEVGNHWIVACLTVEISMFSFMLAVFVSWTVSDWLHFESLSCFILSWLYLMHHSFWYYLYL